MENILNKVVEITGISTGRQITTVATATGVGFIGGVFASESVKNGAAAIAGKSRSAKTALKDFYDEEVVDRTKAHVKVEQDLKKKSK